MGDATWAEQVEARFFMIALGAGSSTSYAAICWLTGPVPAKERMRLQAFNFLARQGKIQGSIEEQSLDAEQEMMEIVTERGNRTVTPQETTTL